MFISKKHISRRTVLQGIGATIALPFLDAMSPAATAWAQTPAGKTPKRFAFVAFPHGAIMDRWSPKETGTGFTMSPILEPLQPFRSHLTIVSGLRNKPAETNEPHGYIEQGWLTCVKPWDFGKAGPTPASAPTRSPYATSVRTRACLRLNSPRRKAALASHGAHQNSLCRRKATRAPCSRSFSARAIPTRNAPTFWRKRAASSIV